MSDSTQKMLSCLGNKKNNASNVADTSVESNENTPEFTYEMKYDMAKMLENCFDVDNPELTPLD